MHALKLALPSAPWPSLETSSRSREKINLNQRWCAALPSASVTTARAAGRPDGDDGGAEVVAVSMM